MNNQIPITDISPSPTPSRKQGREQQIFYSEYCHYYYQDGKNSRFDLAGIFSTKDNSL